MIIIPLEKQVDWTRPPLVTATFILINILVFALWQTQDNEKLDSIIEQHQNSILPALEYGNFINYLYQSGQTPLAQAIESDWKSGNTSAIYPHILTDLGFMNWLSQTDLAFWGEKEYGPWLQAHNNIEKHVRDISYIRYGLSPSESRPLTLFTYQFLHVDWKHLVASLTLLAIIGFGIEAVIGSFYFIIAYLLCGVFAGLTYLAFSGQSTQPMIGSMAPTAAILGLYTIMYTTQKVRLVYWMIGSERSIIFPALIVLPLWATIEGLLYFLGDTTVSILLSHGGGMIAGAGYYIALKRWLIRERHATHHHPIDDDLEYRTQLNHAYKYLETFDFESARAAFNALRESHPDRLPLVVQCYHLEKLSSNQEQSTRYALEIFQQGITHHQHLEIIHDVYCDYAASEYTPPIPYDMDIKLLLAFIQIKQLDTAKKIIKHLMASSDTDSMLVKAILRLSKALEHQGKSDEAYRYENMATKLQSPP